MFLRHTNTYLVAMLMITFTVSAGRSSFAQEVTPGAPQSAEDLENAKAALEDAWRDATTRFQKSTQLENNLRYYDNKVDETKQTLEESAKRKAEVLQRLEGSRSHIDELRSHLDILYSVHEDQLESIRQERVALADYVRIVATRDVVDTEAGVFVDTPFFSVLTNGSLGDNVENALYRDALLSARSTFFHRMMALEEQNGKAIKGLQLVALNLGMEIFKLQEESQSLDTKLEDTQEEYLDQMRSRDLTEAQLESIRNTVAEVNSRVLSAQQSLVRINNQLREHYEKQYSAELNTAIDASHTLADRRDVIMKRQTELAKIKQDAKDAFNAMQAEKNSDHKQYRRTDELKSEVSTAQARIAAIDAILASPMDPEATREEHIERDKLTPERTSLEKQIAFAEQVIPWMEDGFPRERAEDYVRKFAKAGQADSEMKANEAELAQVNVDLVAAQEKIAKIESEKPKIDEQKFAIFTWPVYGTVTAGFYDVNYQKFFGVPHRGVDIAVAQGTPVYSIAEGVVITAHNGGKTGYTYVLIGHRDGYTSLYGHLSKVYVSAGDVLEHGQIIGLSGGRPGTPGAGLMTTGAHVHLEIHRNGEYLNPIQVLLTSSGGQ